eukprot:CAMPEP_0119310232 /NCGR_PEP_ID=MMETSP1333-20130426/18302_1 /TAXON_ID=418940 /ORGANISM="Scyphosphaera apsteinii, Strain RCC1455" /LENGTH=276 /DNA_ID=CAMNT_0007314383 /DNA_START=298 /DNA_END=1128 /DNA_ORIENTATION=-
MTAHVKKRCCLCEELSCPESRDDAHVMRWAAPELVLRPQLVPRCYAVVHMVRDPARWALSLFDYHRQSPTPEQWVLHYRPSCSSTLVESALNMSQELLGGIQALCHRLVQPNISFYDHLTTLPEFDGLRLAAVLNILGLKDGSRMGDVPRSAANAQVLQRSRVAVINVFMDDLILQQDRVITDIASFVLNATMVETGLNATDVETVKVRLSSFMIKSQTANILRKSRPAGTTSHITTSARSAEEKQNLTAMLYKDQVLGPSFMLWWSIINATAQPY